MSNRAKLISTALAALAIAAGWGLLQRPTEAQQAGARQAIAQQPSALQPGTGSRATFMRLKLQPVKEILEAIALEDYDRIVAQSQRIHALSLDESWMVIQTESYRRQSDEFRRAVSVMAEAAKNQNLDGATLGYMQMTLNCVQCHRQLRTPEPQ